MPSVASRGWHRRDPSAPRKPPRTGTAGDRLLGLLDRPWHGAELVQQLGVSRQRVHQVITALSHAGVIRVAVTNPLSFAIARADDTTILLKPEEERVLSALPDQAATTAQKLAVAAHVDQTVVTRVLSTLHQHGFVHPTQSTGKGVMYELTTAGRGHWQRRASLPRAATPPLPFRSGRVQTVLSCLESVGPIRTRDIAQGLGLPLQLINGLMQYLKRRDMVRPVSDARRAPYVLTEEGQRTLAAMRLEELALAA